MRRSTKVALASGAVEVARVLLAERYPVAVHSAPQCRAILDYPPGAGSLGVAVRCDLARGHADKHTARLTW